MSEYRLAEKPTIEALAAMGYAPLSSEAPAGRDQDLFDILVTTDVLAEGMNLKANESPCWTMTMTLK